MYWHCEGIIPIKVRQFAWPFFMAAHRSWPLEDTTDNDINTKQVSPNGRDRHRKNSSTLSSPETSGPKMRPGRSSPPRKDTPATQRPSGQGSRGYQGQTCLHFPKHPESLTKRVRH